MTSKSNARRTPSWLLFCLTLPFSFIFGTSFHQILTTSSQQSFMERMNDEIRRIEQVHRELLKAKDERIRSLEKRLKDLAEMGQNSDNIDAGVGEDFSTQRASISESENELRGILDSVDARKEPIKRINMPTFSPVGLNLERPGIRDAQRSVEAQLGREIDWESFENWFQELEEYRSQLDPEWTPKAWDAYQRRTGDSYELMFSLLNSVRDSYLDENEKAALDRAFDQEWVHSKFVEAAEMIGAMRARSEMIMAETEMRFLDSQLRSRSKSDWSELDVSKE